MGALRSPNNVAYFSISADGPNRTSYTPSRWDVGALFSDPSSAQDMSCDGLLSEAPTIGTASHLHPALHNTFTKLCPRRGHSLATGLAYTITRLWIARA